MRRRMALTGALAGVLALTGCALETRPYAERRQWPLLVHRPEALAPKVGGPVLLVRSFVAGPGMEARGLQSLGADGAIRTEYYEEWSVPPAQAVEEAVRRWLADSGLFSAVLVPGSRLNADLVAEGELDVLWTVPAEKLARAAAGLTLVTDRNATSRLVLQRRFTGQAALGGATPSEAAAAMVAAVAALCAEIERTFRAAV
jgi:cholesterol transport system auxiliary component